MVTEVMPGGGMSENPPITRPRLAAVNRRQRVLRTVEVELLIEEGRRGRGERGQTSAKAVRFRHEQRVSRGDVGGRFAML